MHKSHRYIAFAALSAALLSLLAYAGQPVARGDVSEPASSADLVPNAARRKLLLTASQAAKAAPDLGATAAPTIEEVGDVDSFGRNVKWLGVASMNIALSDTCDDPELACAVLNPAPAVTAFSFQDVARITLPPKATHSLLCYWLSPFNVVTYANPTAAPVVARLRYTPTLTIENEVLDDPVLVDPTTGLPFGGKLTTFMTSSESFEVPLPASLSITERTRDSAVCIAGFLTRRALQDNYGLTENQAKQFFKKQTVVRMNLIGGNAQYVQNASLIFGFRIVGD